MKSATEVRHGAVRGANSIPASRPCLALPGRPSSTSPLPYTHVARNRVRAPCPLWSVQPRSASRHGQRRSLRRALHRALGPIGPPPRAPSSKERYRSFNRVPPTAQCYPSRSHTQALVRGALRQVTKAVRRSLPRASCFRGTVCGPAQPSTSVLSVRGPGPPGALPSSTGDEALDQILAAEAVGDAAAAAAGAQGAAVGGGVHLRQGEVLAAAQHVVLRHEP